MTGVKRKKISGRTGLDYFLVRYFSADHLFTRSFSLGVRQKIR